MCPTIINNNDNEVCRQQWMKHFFNLVKYSRNVKHSAYPYSPPPGVLSFELHYKSSNLIVWPIQYIIIKRSMDAGLSLLVLKVVGIVEG